LLAPYRGSTPGPLRWKGRPKERSGRVYASTTGQTTLSDDLYDTHRKPEDSAIGTRYKPAHAGLTDPKAWSGPDIVALT